MSTVDEWLHLEFWSAGVFGMSHLFYFTIYSLKPVFSQFSGLRVCFMTTVRTSFSCTRLHVQSPWIFTVLTLGDEITIVWVWILAWDGVRSTNWWAWRSKKKPKWSLVQCFFLTVCLCSHLYSIIAIEPLFNRAVMEEMRCSCEITSGLSISHCNWFTNRIY